MTGEFAQGHDEFERFQAALQRHLGGGVVDAWMSDLRFEHKNDDSVVFSTESKLKCDTIMQRFAGRIRDVWSRTNGPVRRVQIIMREKMTMSAARVDALAPRSTADVVPIRRTKDERRSLALDDLVSPCDERSTFERFAVADSNAVAFAAARQAASDNAQSEVVYIYGASGAGKTHLLHAVVNDRRKAHGPGRCAYLTYNALQNGCVNAVFSNGILDLHRDLLAQDVVLIDDIHLLSGSPRTQIEILNLINASLASGRRLVIAGEAAPLKLTEAGLNPRLADRLVGGLSVAIGPADADLRARVLRLHLETFQAQCTVKDDALDFIAQNFTQSLREAVGALKQLMLVYGKEPIAIGRDIAATALRGRLGEFRRKPTLEEVAAASAVAFDISIEELKGRGQYQRLAKARHAFVMVGREALHESFPRIGRALGRDHTTAMSGYRRAQALHERDRKFREAIAAIRASIGAAAD